MAEITTEERVAALEAIQEIVRGDLHEIKTNHLPHIEGKVDAFRLESTQAIGSLRNWIMGALFTSLVIVVQNFLR